MVKLADIRTDFIEKVGQIAQGEALPKIAGRVFGLLMFDGKPVSFGDMAKELQVSRGSISSSVRLLEDRGVIKRMGMPGERQDYFQLAEQPFVGLLENAQKRIERARQDIETTVADLPAEANAVRSRLETYADFYRTLGKGLGHALADQSDNDGA
ncbi:GbsR/MarR family transcriptional regulator [Pararhizobium sp. IMCC21322]|uniref:GbsR/MarR family transcriptional regulator n=1 Tax=Pararhizobium sp. IMCC21322 TaxID=3067903 RepID=UPI002740D615|nr:hypothetical protein [Pararhizobium sp. IMCC21322]